MGWSVLVDQLLGNRPIVGLGPLTRLYLALGDRLGLALGDCLSLGNEGAKVGLGPQPW